MSTEGLEPKSGKFTAVMPAFPDMRKLGKIIVVLVLAVILLRFLGGIWATVPKGQYQIKQTWIIGSVDAKMTPGLWLTFGEVWNWPTAETFYFTADHKEGKAYDQSIEVRFNDGSLSMVSGTCRVSMPRTRDEAVALVTERGFRDYHDLEMKLILPVVRNSLRLTANLMSARESYSEKRPDFIAWSWDQVQFGVYETEEVTRTMKDPISGETVTRTVKVIKRDKSGNPVRQHNPLKGTGITLENFEVKQFVYSKDVTGQIAAQQQAYMAVETARANAAKAEQDALTVEAQGKAQVMGAKYAEEQEKVKAVVRANREKETAEILARKEFEVAKLRKQAAEEERQAVILLAEGEAKARELKMKADNYEALKIDAWKDVQFRWADAFSKRHVPQIIFGGSGSATDPDHSSLGVKSLLDIMILRSLGTDFKIGGMTPTK